jgi:hypothetical protein
MAVDFRDLAIRITQNGQHRAQPNDSLVMGVVVGYDPNYQVDIGGHSYPFLSVQLAGDDSPLHGFRFAETYTPNLGDTVWVFVSGTDGWVICSLAGSSKDVIGQIRSAVGVVGHVAPTASNAISSTSWTPLDSFKVETPILPNRVYQIEAVFTANITGASGNPQFAAGIGTPDGVHQIWTSHTFSVATGVVTVNAKTTWWDTPAYTLTPGQWSTEATWQLNIKRIGGSAGTLTLDSTQVQRLIVKDLGVAS